MRNMPPRMWQLVVLIRKLHPFTTQAKKPMKYKARFNTLLHWRQDAPLLLASMYPAAFYRVAPKIAIVPLYESTVS